MFFVLPSLSLSGRQVVMKEKEPNYLLFSNTCFLSKSIFYSTLGRMYIPGIVMQAFAAELYLKALIVYEGKQIKKIHKLDALFGMLDEVEKNIITASMMAEIRNAKGISESEYGETELLDDFTKAANIFEDWRYFFESGTVSADLDFMKALNDVLYVRCKSLI